MSKVIVEDVDEDGDNDLVVLWFYGNEGVSVFINKKGFFVEWFFLEFLFIYGIFDMEYVDMNGDG